MVDRTSKKRKKIIIELSDDILESEGFRGWFGPNGKCWCNTQKKYVEPNSCDCPECETLRSQDIRQQRYLRLHDDYRSM